MKFRFLAALAIALPVFGQYAGPAILSRGEVPSELIAPDIRFIPQVSVGGVYDTGLSGVAVNDSGQLAGTASYGYYVSWGVSGNHHWRHTQLGLSYNGSITGYSTQTQFNSMSQTMLLGVTHQFNRRAAIRFSEAAGMYSRNYQTTPLVETVPFDPSTTYVPQTDFFDNRTIFATSGVNLTLQKTSRLSFSMGGLAFTNSRDSHSLTNAWGVNAQGDVQYRVTRKSTVGAYYNFMHFGYSSTSGGTDVHGFGASYSRALSARWQLSGYGGMMRVESKYLQTQAVDPLIAALLGITQAPLISHVLQSSPMMAGRISRSMRRGVLYANGGRGVTAGNGFFLTSIVTTVGGGYSYTAFRHWSLNAQVIHLSANSEGTISGKYGNTIFSLSAGRQLGRYTHWSASYSMNNYTSPQFGNYNRRIDMAAITVGFSPGEVRLSTH